MTTYGIAVNSLNVAHRTGVENYLVALLRGMMAVPLRNDERVVLYAARVPEGFAVLPRGWEWRILPWSGKGWTHVRLSWELLRHPPEVFFNPTHEVPVALRRRTKVVTTVHDVAFKRVPGLYDRSAGHRQEYAIRRAVRRANCLLAISKTTEHDLEQLYRVPAAHIAVAPLGIDPARFAGPLDAAVLQRYRLVEGKYLLFVGRLEGKKNVATLVRGFHEFQKVMGEGYPLQLVLAGGWGFGRERIEAAMREAGGDVRALGYVADADVLALYKGALAFCFPSYYEGFGLPVLEAFAAGVPVIASTTPALREVAGEAAVFASPDDAHAWAVAIKTMACDAALRARLVAAGQERLKLFTWEETARRTWEALRGV